ncbi:MAG: hypothetical protein WCG93_14220 [Paludibacter sp.]
MKANIYLISNEKRTDFIERICKTDVEFAILNEFVGIYATEIKIKTENEDAADFIESIYEDVCVMNSNF